MSALSAGGPARVSVAESLQPDKTLTDRGKNKALTHIHKFTSAFFFSPQLMQLNSVQFSSVQFSSVQFSSVQFSSVQFSNWSCDVQPA